MTDTRRTTIRRGRKFDQVIAGAREVFLRDGYEGASVGDIARAAGVSKATLYSYFPDKRFLFLEVVRHECDRQAEEAVRVIDVTLPPAAVLRAAGERMIGFMLSDFGRQIYRLCIAESARFPVLGQEFYETGPMMARKGLGEYLRGACAKGDLRIEDFDLAADQFAELCRVDLANRLMFGIADRFTPDEIARVLDGAVGMFMARYGVRG